MLFKYFCTRKNKVHSTSILYGRGHQRFTFARLKTHLIECTGLHCTQMCPFVKYAKEILRKIQMQTLYLSARQNWRISRFFLYWPLWSRLHSNLHFKILQIAEICLISAASREKAPLLNDWQERLTRFCFSRFSGARRLRAKAIYEIQLSKWEWGHYQYDAGDIENNWTRRYRKVFRVSVDLKISSKLQ